MSDPDYYKVLGVSRKASADKIRKAYKKLAKENHPDSKPDDEAAAEKFKRIQDAYSVLSDAKKRQQYDQFGTTFPGSGPGPFPGGGGWPGGGGRTGRSSPLDLRDLFGGIFGGKGRGGFASQGQAAPPLQGDDIRIQVEIPFQVAANGGNHSVQLQQDGKMERLNVKIPPGVTTGSVIRLAGQGQPSLGQGPAGDLKLSLKVAPHPYFRRQGRHLLIDVPITPGEAALGAKVDVPTLSEGMVSVTIPPGTSGGTKLRLKGKGVKDQKTGETGDQHVVVKIVVPKVLSDDARQAYERLADVAPMSPRSGLW